MCPASRLVARFNRMLHTPLRRPRITTRLLMVLVAAVAVGIWAMVNVPLAVELTELYRLKTEQHADLERTFREMQREKLVRVRASQSDLEEWRRDTEAPDELTERYLAARRDFYINDANYQREMASYHADLKKEYRWARWFPLVSLPPDPAPPSDPLSPRPLTREPGEMIVEGGMSVAFSPRGTGLVVGCKDEAVRILELPSRRILANFPLPEGVARSVRFSPDGTALFAHGDGRPVWRWDLATGHAGRALPGFDQSPGHADALITTCAAWCPPDGGTIAVAGGGSLANPSTRNTSNSIYGVRLFDARTGVLKWEHKGTGDWPLAVCSSPAGETLACGCGPAVVLLETRTGKLKKTVKPEVGSVIAVAFSPDGRTLAGGGSDVLGLAGFRGNGRVTLWDGATGRILRTLEGPTGLAQSVAFSPDGRTVAAGGTGSVKLGKDVFANSRNLNTASEVRLWDVATGRLIWTAEGDSDCAISLAFSPDGRLLAFCDQRYVYIIDACSGRLKQIVMETVERYRVLTQPRKKLLPPRT